MNKSKKKIIISEKILQEIQTKQNELGHDSASSSVYLGKNWVKKYSNQGAYPEIEIFQYQLMQNNSDIFPETKVKKIKGQLYNFANGKPEKPKVFNNVDHCRRWLEYNLTKNNTPIRDQMLEMGYDAIVIKSDFIFLQKKVDVLGAKHIYKDINRVFKDTLSDGEFRDFLENIVYDGLKTRRYQDIYEDNLKRMKEKNKELVPWFKQFVHITNQLHLLLKNNLPPNAYSIDLHNENFGIDNGKIKIIDFLISN